MVNPFHSPASSIKFSTFYPASWYRFIFLEPVVPIVFNWQPLSDIQVTYQEL